MRQALFLALLGASVAAQESPKQDPAQPEPKVNQSRIDPAILKGIAFLRNASSPAHYPTLNAIGIKDSDELILWTFVHAGVPEDDPKFQELFERMVRGPLEKTYKVSVQAMILEELDRVKYQARIHQCAQFLVDNQCKNGQWGYGTPTTLPPVKDVATGVGSRKAGGGPTFDRDGRRIKPKVTRRMIVQKTRDGPDTGDNSNSQYASLGLRACHDAGIATPKEAVLLAGKWWRDSQLPDPNRNAGDGGVRSWNYGEASNPSVPPKASMTAGAVGGLVIYAHLLDKDWKKDPAVKAGLNWVAQSFSVAENMGQVEDTRIWYYYYLYALERLGVLCGAEKIGTRDWYAEGASAILAAQKADGSWHAGATYGSNPTWDTCFAILFLKRATRPLVPSVDRFNPK